MGRSGYSDECDGWELIKYRGQVYSALRGKRGQAFLNELLDAMEGMPEKILIANELRDADGDMCALGVVGAARGIDLESLDIENYENLAQVFEVARQLIQEVEFKNDQDFCYSTETPEQRWKRVYDWASRHIIPVPIDTAA